MCGCDDNYICIECLVIKCSQRAFLCMGQGVLLLAKYVNEAPNKTGKMRKIPRHFHVQIFQSNLDDRFVIHMNNFPLLRDLQQISSQDVEQPEDHIAVIKGTRFYSTENCFWSPRNNLLTMYVKHPLEDHGLMINSYESGMVNVIKYTNTGQNIISDSSSCVMPNKNERDHIKYLNKIYRDRHIFLPDNLTITGKRGIITTVGSDEDN